MGMGTGGAVGFSAAVAMQLRRMSKARKDRAVCFGIPPECRHMFKNLLHSGGFVEGVRD